jgi:DNA-binding NarL/FixJ family response regulator
MLPEHVSLLLIGSSHAHWTRSAPLRCKLFDFFSNLLGSWLLREVGIIRFLAEGKANKEIAAELETTIRTVETHRARIILTLVPHSLAEHVHYAIPTRSSQRQRLDS